MRSAEELRALLERLDGEPADALESETVEFKAWEDEPKALVRMLREAVICFANARGGTIIVGVRDRVRTRASAIVGIGTCDIPSLRRSIYDGTDPHLLVEIEELVELEGRLLLVHVPKGLPPHTTSDGVGKIRLGKDCVPLTGRMLAQLLASGGQLDPTAETVVGATEADLSKEAIVALRSVIEREAQAKALARQDDRALVRSLGAVGAGGVTLAGLLLLGAPEALLRYAPQHELIFLRYRSATRYDQRKDLREPLIVALGEVERLVSVHNRLRTVQEEGFGQLELPDLSWEVAREAILNAVIHRDYFLRQGVQIALHRDRLEVLSPGGFVGGITPENVLRHAPVHRNELLARMFQSVGLVNRVGLGVDRIYDGLLRLGKDIPRYTADEAHVRLVVSFDTHEAFALFVESERREGRSLELDDLLVLRALLRRDLLDRWTAGTVLELTEEEAAVRLARLRDAGYLVARGRGRSASYTLRRELAERLRGRATVDSETPIEEEAVRLRILALLRERGRLTNSEIRRFSGLSKMQVYRLVKELEREGLLRLVGRGRGAFISGP